MISIVAKDFILVKVDRSLSKIQLNEIKYIKGLKDYVIIHGESQKWVVAMNLKTIYAQLPNQLFARISKSCIINVNAIVDFDNYFVHVLKESLPIGNQYKDLFFKDYVSKQFQRLKAASQ
jgi:two-component system, LytTR family, response regulator